MPSATSLAVLQSPLQVIFLHGRASSKAFCKGLMPLKWLSLSCPAQCNGENTKSARVLVDHSASMALPFIWRHLHSGLPTYSSAWSSLKLCTPSMDRQSFLLTVSLKSLHLTLLLFLFQVVNSVTTKTTSLHLWAPPTFTVPDTQHAVGIQHMLGPHCYRVSSR